MIFPMRMHGLVAGLAVLCLTGCAAVQTRILPRNPQEEGSLRPLLARGDTPAVAMLMRALRGPDPVCLSSALESARLSWPGVLAGREEDAVVYRAAVRRVVELQAANGWRLQPDASSGGPRSFAILRDGRDRIDPSLARQLVAADQISIRGLRERIVVDGLGLPFVASFAPDSPFLRGQPGIPPVGLAVPATAVLTFPRAGAAKLEFIATLRRESVVVDGRSRTLAADFSAPVAMLVGKGANRSLDVVALLSPLEHLPRAGLYQVQPHDPSKIPVVFVHGLMSRPETWRQVLNELQADPVIRRNFEFWFFLYPTGLPVWQSAALLRSELDRFNAALEPSARTAADRARLHSKVLIGHSMGGLVSNLMIRDSGTRLWERFSEIPLDRLPVSPAARARIEELIAFRPREDVSRVIFAAVPHRGSRLALRPTAMFFAAKVRFGLPELQPYRPLLLTKVREHLRRDLAVPANSLRFLRAGSPFLEAILDLPATPRVEVHSIIGDRGRNDAPRGGDGVVEYQSAHYPGAVTEKIVPAGHGAHEHPEAIREMKRILRESL